MIYSTWKTKIELVMTVPRMYTLHIKSPNWFDTWSSWIQLKGWHSFWRNFFMKYLPLKHVYRKCWYKMSLNMNQIDSKFSINKLLSDKIYNLFNIWNGTEDLSVWKYRGTNPPLYLLQRSHDQNMVGVWKGRKGKQERGKLSFGPCLRLNLIK